mgnify:CR=1 FL=1
MKQIRILLGMMSICLFISACGPIYNTEYTYVPPKSKVGKMCISQCQQNKMMCEQLNESRKDACLAKVRQDALYEYELYKLNQEKLKQPVLKSPRNFEKNWKCSQTSQCQTNFKTCYESCGGEIHTHQVCTAFCG